MVLRVVALVEKISLSHKGSNRIQAKKMGKANVEIQVTVGFGIPFFVEKKKDILIICVGMDTYGSAY